MTPPADEHAEPAPPEPALRKVTPDLREARHGHPGLVVWLTGLSGAGKTTLATGLERRLFDAGRATYLLDGDILRRGLCGDLGFSAADRRENVRRAGEVAALFADAGSIAICAFISPSREDRDRIHRLLAPGRFIEVFVNAPIEICERRDVKGFYAKARAGLIKDFTGVSAPYEPPLRPELEIHTDRLTIAECVSAVFEHVTAASRLPSR
jgi:adenylyl-sulfate kinase